MVQICVKQPKVDACIFAYSYETKTTRLRSKSWTGPKIRIKRTLWNATAPWRLLKKCGRERDLWWCFVLFCLGYVCLFLCKSVFYPKYSPILSGLGERRGFSFTTCGNSQRGPDFLRVPSLVPTFKLLFTFTNLGVCFCKVCFNWGGSFWLYHNCTMRENLKGWHSR